MASVISVIDQGEARLKTIYPPGVIGTERTVMLFDTDIDSRSLINDDWNLFIWKIMMLIYHSIRG